MDNKKFYSIISELIGSDLNTSLKESDELYFKLHSQGYIPLTIEKIGTNKIAIAHNSILNGDVMADPDVTFIVKENEIEPITFQNDYAGIYQEVYDGDKCDLKIKTDLFNFCVTWFKNIQASNYTIE